MEPGKTSVAIAALVGMLLSLGAGTSGAPANPGAAHGRAVALPFALESRFHPSGWMGDGIHGRKQLDLRTVQVLVDGVSELATRIEYRRGPKGWAGIYWQHPENNWGTQPGLDLSGARRITFLARGDRGGEIAEFKAGGTEGRHADSFAKSLGKVSLSAEWRAFSIDLTKEDLSNVVGAFAWVAAAGDKEVPYVVYIARLTVE